MAFDDRYTERYVVVGLLSMVVVAAVATYPTYQRAIATWNADGDTMGVRWYAITLAWFLSIVVSVVVSMVAIGGVCWLAVRISSRSSSNRRSGKSV